MMKFISLIFSFIISSEPLYCVIGGGFTGINIARKLQQQGKLVEILEKHDYLGGKATEYKNDEGKVELGPLFFTDQQLYVKQLINEFHLNTTKLYRNEVYLFDKQGNIKIMNTTYTLIEIKKLKRFLNLRSSFHLNYFYLSLNSNFTISFYDWLNLNDLLEIEPILSKIITSQGYGLTKDVPAFYLLMFFDVGRIQLLLDPKQTFLILNEGVNTLINKMSENLNFRKNAKVIKINKLGTSLELIMNLNGINFHKICNKVILAFPPVYDQMNKLLADLDPRYQLFKQTKIHKYLTNVYEAKNIQHLFYLENYVNEPEGKGDIIAIIKQGKLVSTYSWIKGSYSTRCSRLEVNELKRISDHTMSELNSNPIQSLKIKNWNYFPHIDLHNQFDFFQKLHQLQGLNSIYFASTIQSFEIVEHALAMADSFVDTYLL